MLNNIRSLDLIWISIERMDNYSLNGYHHLINRLANVSIRLIIWMEWLFQCSIDLCCKQLVSSFSSPAIITIRININFRSKWELWFQNRFTVSTNRFNRWPLAAHQHFKSKWFHLEQRKNTAISIQILWWTWSKCTEITGSVSLHVAVFLSFLFQRDKQRADEWRAKQWREKKKHVKPFSIRIDLNKWFLL